MGRKDKKTAEQKARVAAKKSKKAAQKEKKAKGKVGDDSDAEDVDLDTLLDEYSKNVRSAGSRFTIRTYFAHPISKRNFLKSRKLSASLHLPGFQVLSSGHPRTKKNFFFSGANTSMALLQHSTMIFLCIVWIKMNGRR